MSAGEILWRTRTAVRAATTREGRLAQPVLRGGLDWPTAFDEFKAAAGRPVLLDRARARRIAAESPDVTAGLLAAAGRAREGRVTYFGYPEAELATPVAWHTDAVSGVRWPLTPSRRLDHRSSAGDPKWIWELNRLQHLPQLVEAWLLTGEQDYADTALEHLEGWIAQNPPGIGIAWRGAFEAGVRAISVAVALQGLRDHPGLTLDLYRDALAVLAESARRCWADRSLFSSANNHLVGELAGLAVVARLHPELAQAAVWGRRASAGLAVEAERQILPDGAGAEQAFAYQIFTADLLLVVAVLEAAAGSPAPREILSALTRSADYLVALVGAGDPVPRYGDDDEGFALRLDGEPVPNVRLHLAAVAAVTGDPVAARHGRRGTTAAWFEAAAGGDAAPTPSVTGTPTSRYFPDGGLVVLRSGRRRVTMDVGPLGYLAIAAHGHADALSVTIADEGTEIVGDPGAGAYFGHPDWRRMHRSTAVHATLAVDDRDQSESGGPFLWNRHAAVRVRGVDLDRGIVDAEHDGYRSGGDPVTHRRVLVAGPDRPTVVVLDLVDGERWHRLRTAWPTHPDLDVRLVDGAHVVTSGGRPVLGIHHSAVGREWKAHQERGGDGERGLGWWSDRLESRRPAWLIGATVDGPTPCVVATVLDTRGALLRDVTVALDGDIVTVTWTEGDMPGGIRVDVGGVAAVEAIPHSGA
jgi:uncharacterized heparinase superfamily protein